MSTPRQLISNPAMIALAILGVAGLIVSVVSAIAIGEQENAFFVASTASDRGTLVEVFRALARLALAPAVTLAVASLVGIAIAGATISSPRVRAKAVDPTRAPAP